MKPYEVLVVGGSEYHFKITTANAVKLEEAIETDLLSGLNKFGEIKILSQYYYYAAVSFNDSINSIDDVYQLFDDYIVGGGNYETLHPLNISAFHAFKSGWHSSYLLIKNNRCWFYSGFSVFFIKKEKSICWSRFGWRACPCD